MKEAHIKYYMAGLLAGILLVAYVTKPSAADIERCAAHSNYTAAQCAHELGK